MARDLMQTVMEWVPVDRLHPYERNPRRMSEKGMAKLRESLRRFGFTAPILAQRGTGMIVAGHQRYKAALAEGYDRVPVVWLDLSHEEAVAYNLADNRLAEEAEWDDDKLAQVLAELQGAGIDLTITGFDTDELDKALAKVTAGGEGEGTSRRQDEQEDAEPPAEPVTQPGDLWLLGRHRLLCGDAANPADVERLLDGVQPVLVCTSFPYGLGLDYGETYQDTMDNLRALLETVPPLLYKHLKPGGFVVTNFGDIISARGFLGTDEPCEYPMAVEYWPAFRKAGFLLNTRRVWAKPHARVEAPWCASSNRAASDWEHLWTWEKGGLTEEERAARDRRMLQAAQAREAAAEQAKPAGDDWEHLWTWKKPGEGLNERRDPSFLGVWDSTKLAGVELGKEIHPAAFPLGIAQLVLQVYSNRGEDVWDPFGGTGTTIVAAEVTGRTGYSTEINPAFCDLIIQRWEKLTGKKAVKVE